MQDLLSYDNVGWLASLVLVQDLMTMLVGYSDNTRVLYYMQDLLSYDNVGWL